ncbi:hsp90 co-chaperone Cdc37-like 1 [Syngnathoides biaculeatus]|uniref:hsp90 co-chaperone Cdc37-like 1 n=1 Tax=Syngnathoides biaculeatus TaxID=300417 RepID=UPI002ADDA974|nr:hsp90 co-chaperone Cdc37-like 1 [Syngnathoides biaculeatus]XP_061658262.1 hsp90 co-chaperone Cdc37-like 1 [Syngnathoides biaculeatus]XP_061658263.1 hsp90 co-chaperone Cdc37-like 1 [Syngnathoides biaculeatus]
MEWRNNNDGLSDNESPETDSCSRHQQISSTHLCDCAESSICQSQEQESSTTSMVSSWMLAEAQDRLCALKFHCSESLEQEHARTRASPTDLTHTEEEWRRKESMLGGQATNRGPVLGADGSWDVFDKSIINIQNEPVEAEQCKESLHKSEQDLRHFGMLRRWDDSQRFLAEKPQLICDETANYLFLWCITLQEEGKEALMEQVAHQAVVMRFILEMASNSQQDPRGCFRQFFHKAKEGQNVYLEVFHTELEAFKYRVREHVVQCKSIVSNNTTQQPTNGTNCRLNPKEAQNSLTQVQEYPSKRCLEAGLLISTGRWTKDDVTESDDIRMMETS